MSSKDYLTRYFQQMAQVLAVLLGMRNKGENQLVLDEIDKVLDTWFSINAKQINQSSVEELLELINDGSGQDIDKIKVIAELLFQKAISYKILEKHDEMILLASKALGFFRLIDIRSNEYSIEIQERIAELDQIVT